MRMPTVLAPGRSFKTLWLCKHFLLLLTFAWLLSGCIAKVQIPAVEQFKLASGEREEVVDAETHEEVLLTLLHQLMKANEGDEVPFCTANKDSKQCIKEGFSVFVLGGVIPGIGKRKRYIFSDISLENGLLAFTKDNGGTTFIGTPMLALKNNARATVENGGIHVQMDKYYACWAGIGHMYMAEGWAVDYIDLSRGIVGLQLELDIKGYVTTGGGSRYILLQFSNIPEPVSAPENKFDFPIQR